MSVTVKINVGKHSSQVDRRSRGLLEKLLRGMGLVGHFEVRVGPQVAGGAQFAGIPGATIRPIGPKSPRTVTIAIQPKCNDSRREFIMDVPNTEDLGVFIQRFGAYVAGYTDTDRKPVEATKGGQTIGEIRAKMDRLQTQINELQAPFAEQEQNLLAREAELNAREEQIKIDRRQLLGDRAELERAILQSQADQRQLRYEIGLAEIALEDAQKAVLRQSIIQLRSVATRAGVSVEEVVALVKQGR